MLKRCWKATSINIHAFVKIAPDSFTHHLESSQVQTMVRSYFSRDCEQSCAVPVQPPAVPPIGPRLVTTAGSMSVSYIGEGRGFHKSELCTF